MKVDAKEVQEKLTARFIAAIESGQAQGRKWKKPWRSIERGLAKRADGKLTYSGSNQFFLTMHANMAGIPNFWGTPKQFAELAVSRKETFDYSGQRCAAEIYKPNIFMVEKEEKDAKGKPGKVKFPVIRSFSVFPVLNISQVKGTEKLLELLTEKEDNALTEHERNAAAENFISAQAASVSFGGNRAFYTPGTDSITMPELGQFETAGGYYSTFLHELTHWTGHGSRLNRPGIAKFDGFGSEQYAKEELVAELGSAFASNFLGIGEDVENHESYLGSWIKALQNDTKFILKASGQAFDAFAHMVAKAGHDVKSAPRD